MLKDHPNYRRDENGLEWLDFGGGQGPDGPAAISGNGKVLLTVRGIGTALVHDIESGDLIGKITPKSPLEGKTWEGRNNEFKVFIESAALNRNGDRALLGLNDSTAGVFDVASGKRLWTFGAGGRDTKPKWGNIRGIAYSPDSSLFAVGFWDFTVGVWQAETHEAVAMLQHPAEVRRNRRSGQVLAIPVTCVSISADNSYVFAGFQNTSVMVWEIATKRVVFDAHRHTMQIIGICTVLGGLRWATGSGEIWQAEDGGEPVTLLETGEVWTDAVFHPGGEELIARCVDGRVKKSTVTGGQAVLCDSSAGPFAVRDGDLISYDESGEREIFLESPQILRVGGGKIWQTIRTNDPFSFVRPSPDGEFVATVGFFDNVMELWDLPTATLRHRFECERRISALAISRDGELVAAGFGDTDIQIWNTDTGQREYVIADGERHQYPQSLAFGPEKSWLVCGARGIVRLHRLGAESSPAAGSRAVCYEDLIANTLLVLSSGTILLFREDCIEAWDRLDRCIWRSDFPERARPPWYLRPRIAVDRDETRLVMDLDQARLGIWSLEDGELLRIVGLDIPRSGSIADLLDDADCDMGLRKKTMWRAPGGPYFYVPLMLYGGTVHLPRSADGRYTLSDTKDKVVMVALDGRGGVVRRMPFRGYAKAFCIAQDRMLALNFDGELFIQTIAD